jgi:hypothetical protein
VSGTLLMMILNPRSNQLLDFHDLHYQNNIPCHGIV